MTPTPFETIIGELGRKWELAGIRNRHVASDDDVATFQGRHGIILPSNIRSYFQTLNGTTAGRYGMEDGDLYGFWHLDQMYGLAEESWGQEARGSVPPEYASTSFIFADYSIAAFVLAVQISQNPGWPNPVLVSHGGPTTVVTPTFEEFFERYLAGDEGVLYP